MNPQLPPIEKGSWGAGSLRDLPVQEWAVLSLGKSPQKGGIQP